MVCLGPLDPSPVVEEPAEPTADPIARLTVAYSGDPPGLSVTNVAYVKVSTQDSSGALFLTEQPITRRGSGPPKHYHEEQDEWFYCLEGESAVDIGDRQFKNSRPVIRYW